MKVLLWVGNSKQCCKDGNKSESHSLGGIAPGNFRQCERWQVVFPCQSYINFHVIHMVPVTHDIFKTNDLLMKRTKIDT
jgi:hypothetical protein